MVSLLPPLTFQPEGAGRHVYVVQGRPKTSQAHPAAHPFLGIAVALRPLWLCGVIELTSLLTFPDDGYLIEC